MSTDMEPVSRESLPMPPPDTILQTLEKIYSGSVFHSKKRMCQLLKYLIEENLNGRADKLKGYTIALEVFKRDKNFDPNLDPIVRIQIGRLRRALQQYYSGEGRNDSFQIFIPKGSYVPVFILNNNPDSITDLKENVIEENQSLQVRPSIAVLPFINLTGDPDKDYLAAGFTEELTIELSKYENFQIICYRSISDINENRNEAISILKELHTHFYIEGSVRSIDNRVKISIKLIDSIINEHVWSEQYHRDLTTMDLIVIQEDIARDAATIIASEYGVIPNKLTREIRNRKIKGLDTYAAILRYYHFEMIHTRETYLTAFNALEQAVKRDPESGLATAMLANLYGNKYMLNAPDNENTLDKCIELSNKAIQLEPNHQFVRLIYAWLQFVLNKKDAFFIEMEKTLALNPNSPFRIGSIGFFLSLYGEWERGKTFLDQAFKQNVKVPAWYHGVTTLYFYRQNDYGNAYKEALKYDIPGVFWGPMLRIACLGQLHRTAEIKANLEHLKTLRPDFSNKARYLISLYVKEEDLVDHIIEGLQKAGLEIM